jgi:outer membrane protein, multidrug efflux system
MILAFLGGCTLAPRYDRPAPPVSSDWPTGAAYQEAKTGSGIAPLASDVPWREFFTDDRLRKIIETALRNNRDLRIAASNVERARAYYGIQKAGLLPALNAVGSGVKKRVPADLSMTHQRMTSEQYEVNFGISSWEIDFFGRIRSLKDKALEEYLATGEAHRGAQIAIVSAVAHAYLALAVDSESLTLAKSTLEARKVSSRLIKKRVDVGIASEMDLRQAQTQVDAARGDVARYTQLTAQDENMLNLLAGNDLPSALLHSSPERVNPLREFTTGLSSNLLLCRPDVVAAEHQLKAANANIGAARASFFPRIALTTALGTASAELSGLFKSGQGTWSFTPQIALPIFDARTWSAYDVTKAEKEIAVAQYEKAIQTAFREVADALALRGTVNRRIEAQQSIVEAASETYRLSHLRYTKGIDSYLGVLDAQRSVYGAQQGLIALRYAGLANLVTLYTALGGGNSCGR